MALKYFMTFGPEESGSTDKKVELDLELELEPEGLEKVVLELGKVAEL